MASLDIEITAGIVTLTGTVDNLLAKARAADVATTVKGVRSVINRIDVEPVVHRSDEEIENLVAAALIGDAATEAYEIEAQVDDGVMTSKGTVDSWQEEQLAVKVAKGMSGVEGVASETEDVASRMNGVLRVDNNLDISDEFNRVLYDPYVYNFDYEYDAGYEWADDAEIHEAIVDQIWWSPFVDSDDVHVTVEDGVAILTGAVETWAERKAAMANAYDRGAIRVDNNLEVI